MTFKRRTGKPFIDFTPIVKPGDICVAWGSWIVSLLVRIKDGIKDPPTHNMHVHSRATVASAEPSGYKEVDLNEAFTGAKRVMVFRFKDITADQISKLKRQSERYFKKKYDYSMYFIVILRVMTVFIPVMFFLVLGGPLYLALGLFVVLLILYFPLLSLLRKWEKVTVACSEAEGELFSSVGLLRGIGDETNLAPHIWLWILLNRPDVRLVLDTRLSRSKHGKRKKH